MPSKKPKRVLYLDPPMLAELEKWAKAEKRSLNNLIVCVLSEALEARTNKKAGD